MMKKLFYPALLIFLFNITYAYASTFNAHLMKAIIANAKQRSSLSEKIVYISQQFLGSPYLLNNLGEGKKGLVDQQPAFRSDVFDCQTYIETVLAMAEAQNLQQFKQHLLAIRYQQQHASFLTRNHFISSDWVMNNSRKGYIKNDNDQIAPHQVKYIQATINKQRWLHQTLKKRFFLVQPSLHAKQQAMQRLQTVARTIKANTVHFPYISLNRLFKNNGAILKRIPNAAIVFIIKPSHQSGTDIVVSHMGFAIWKNGILYFRNASLLQQKVTDQPLADYLAIEWRHDRQHLKGISIYTAIPGVARNSHIWAISH